MATKLEELVVSLTAKNDKFDKAFRQSEAQLKEFAAQSKRSAASTEKAFNGLNSSALRVGRAMKALAGAVVITKMATATKEAFAQANALGDVSDKIGINVEALQQLHYAFASTGVESEKVNKALTKMGGALAEFAQTGVGPGVVAFEALGLSAADIRQNFGTLEEFIPELARRMSELESEEAKLLVMQKLVGNSGTALKNVLEQGDVALFALMQTARDIGYVFDESLILRAQQTNTAFDLATTALGVRFKTALIEMEPILKTSADLMVSLAQKIGKIPEGIARMDFNVAIGNLKSLEAEIYAVEEALINEDFGLFGAYVSAQVASDRLRELRLEHEKLTKEAKEASDNLKQYIPRLKDTETGLGGVAGEARGAGEAFSDLKDDHDAHIKTMLAWKDAQQKSVDALYQTTDALLAEADAIRAGIAQGHTMIQIQDAITAAKLRTKAATDGLTDAEEEAIQTQMQAIVINREAKESLEEYNASMGEGIDLAGMMDEMITGLMRGTLKLKDFFKKAGQTIIAEFSKSFLFGKREKFDVPLKANMMGLVGPNGIIGDIFGKGGSMASGNFSQGFFAESWGFLKSGNWSQIFNMSPSHGLGKVFHNAGVVGSALMGYGLAEGFKSLFGVMGSKEASIGGAVGSTVGAIIGSIWGPVGSFVGSFIGNMIGSLIGGLFANKPTKGTRIRKAVRDWLVDLNVVFAEELDRKNYFFDETIAKREAMGLEGGAGFLAASKQVLADSGVRRELQDQLVSLGTAVTADMARDLGKSLEQTGTTFANMIIDNFGGDEEKISAFIADLVEKAEIEFGGLTEELSKAFRLGEIGAEHYTQAIEGAASIFFTELPDAIDVAKIALDSFVDGIFDLEVFEAKLTDVVKKFE